LLPNHKIWQHCLWTAYLLIRGFTLMYTLHHMWFRVFTLLR